MTGSRNRKSTGGWADITKLPKGDHGRRLCRRCGIEVPVGRRTFCSEECIHEWQLRTSPRYLRMMVFDRDKGVCSKCGVDTKAGLSLFTQRTGNNTGHLWQADHIKPVAEGGGECGLDNIRTLCTACHKEATAELRRRLSLSRVQAKPLPLLDTLEQAEQR